MIQQLTSTTVQLDQLSPVQQQALHEVIHTLQLGKVIALSSAAGRGRTTVLQALHREIGGCLLTMRSFMDALTTQDPLALEETFEWIVRAALEQHPAVIVDDLHLLANVATCGHFYPRTGLLEIPITNLSAFAEQANKRLIFGVSGHGCTSALWQVGHWTHIGHFTPDDYQCLCQAYLEPAQIERLSFAKIHRFAPRLNGHQLRAVCEWLRDEEELDTERFIDFLRARRLASNVDIGEVQAVGLHDLKGIDDIIEALEANIALPLENDELAVEYGVRPKRGVLLAGPPGTGKTTVGRALAHRLKGKFFLIDGTVISGTRDFYERVGQIFEAAKQNAPSIIFIDDSDVIFEANNDTGLYRYLLTVLDGLESESAGRVCVMLTAMNVGNLPPALLRSGRIELWLETRLPDEHARAQILEEHAAALPPAVGRIDVSRLADATDGLTGADLKRVVEDGKLLLAYDRARGLPPSDPTDYFIRAVATVKANKERYASAEQHARSQRPVRPAYYDVARA